MSASASTSVASRRERLRAATAPGFGRWCGRDYVTSCAGTDCDVVVAHDTSDVPEPWLCKYCREALEAKEVAAEDRAARFDPVLTRHAARDALTFVRRAAERLEVRGLATQASEAYGDVDGWSALTMRGWASRSRRAAALLGGDSRIACLTLAAVCARAAVVLARHARALRAEAVALASKEAA